MDIYDLIYGIKDGRIEAERVLGALITLHSCEMPSDLAARFGTQHMDDLKKLQGMRGSRDCFVTS